MATAPDETEARGSRRIAVKGKGSRQPITRSRGRWVKGARSWPVSS